MPREYPLQPLRIDAHGTIRFLDNPIVRRLLDHCGALPPPYKLGLNELCDLGFSNEAFEQFAQLIGYSVSGFGSLSYVSAETFAKAEAAAAPLLQLLEESR